MKPALLAVLVLLSFSRAYPSLTDQEARGEETRRDALELFRAGMYSELARHYRDGPDGDGSSKLLLALSYRQLGLAQQSIGELKKLYLQRNSFRSYSAYLLGVHFEEHGDPQGAVRWYKNAVDAAESPGSPFPKSADGRAVALASLHRMANLAVKDGSHFDSVEKVLAKASDAYPVALYHLGLLFLARGERERAVRTFVVVLRSVRDEKVTKRVLEALTADFRLIEKADSRGVSKREIVQLCLKSGLFRNALFVTYLLPYGPDVARLRALCFSNMGDHASAALLYNEYYAQFKDPDGLLQAAIACYRSRDTERAGELLAAYMDETRQEGRINADALYLQLRLDREKVPPETFVRSSEAFVNGNRAYPELDRVIQETFYFTLQKKLSDQALEYLKGAFPSIREPLFKAWGSYLLALYLDKRYYVNTLSIFPGSYYYHMSASELVLENDLAREADELYDLGNFDDALELYIRLYSKGAGEGHVRDRITRILQRIPSVSRFFEMGNAASGMSSSILFTLFKAGLHSELEDLVEEALTMEGEKEDYYYFYLLSLAAYEEGKPFVGITHAEDMLSTIDPRYAIFLPADVQKLLYPSVFRELIRERTNGQAGNFDDLFVLSIIREESRYNDRAQSPRGALGLMQILPSTARWISGGRLDRADLLDPGINIRTGVLYLNFLSRRFGSDAEVLAAYNGGPGNVKKWLAVSDHGDERKFIEEIPFPETRNYVKRVLTSYAMYRSIYGAL